MRSDKRRVRREPPASPGAWYPDTKPSSEDPCARHASRRRDHAPDVNHAGAHQRAFPTGALRRESPPSRSRISGTRRAAVSKARPIRARTEHTTARNGTLSGKDHRSDPSRESWPTICASSARSALYFWRALDFETEAKSYFSALGRKITQRQFRAAQTARENLVSKVSRGARPPRGARRRPLGLQGSRPPQPPQSHRRSRRTAARQRYFDASPRSAR